MQLKFDFAGILSQCFKVPRTFQPAKRAINQTDFHQLRILLEIFRREAGFDRVIIDVQRCHSFKGVAELELGIATPGQKDRIILATIHQFEHAFSGLLDQYCFFNQSHTAAAFLYPVK